MKTRFSLFLLCSLFFVGILLGCGGQKSEGSETEEEATEEAVEENAEEIEGSTDTDTGTPADTTSVESE